MSAEVQMSAEVRVDTHAHIWGPAMPFWSRAWKRPDYAYTVETYLDTLDASGVDFAVIAAASLFGTYNDYVIRALRQHRRLRG
jgi:predicted TIM-barrel fold metal-dependent hydrolase